MSKSTALLIGLTLIVVFGVISFLKPSTATVILPPILTAIVTLVSTYIGLQVVNNGVRGKYFNRDLYDAENNGDKV